MTASHSVILLVAAWLIVGIVLVFLGSTRGELVDAALTLAGVILWPLGVLAYLVRRHRARRRERERQERITARVASGEYNASYAYNSLEWKGPKQ